MTPPPAQHEPEYLKVEEVAARLKLKDKTIRDWILRGELPAYKLGKEWRIRRDDFDQAMQARRTTAEPASGAVSGTPTTPDRPERRFATFEARMYPPTFTGGSRSCVASHLSGRTLHRGWRGGCRAHEPRASGHRGHRA
jgi:excisionase family DNA binding protein